MMLVNTRGGLFGQSGRGGGVFSSEQRGFGDAPYGSPEDRAAHMRAVYYAERRRLGLGDEATDTSVVATRGGVFGPGGHGGGIFDYATAFGAVAPGSINVKKLTAAIFAAQAKNKEPDIELASSVAGNALAKSRGNDKGGEYAKVVKTALDKGKKPLAQLQDVKYYDTLAKKLSALANTSDPLIGVFYEAGNLQQEYNAFADENLGKLAHAYGLKATREAGGMGYTVSAKTKESEYTRDPKTWGRVSPNGVFTPRGGLLYPPAPKITVPYEDWKKQWGPFEGKTIKENAPIWDWLAGQEPADQSAFLRKYANKGEEAKARENLVALQGWFRSYYSIAKAEAAQLIAERAAAVAVKIPAEGRNWWPWIIAAGVATVGVGVLVSREKKAGAV
jgi:hypothetical protein